jgi:hypothetical protein
MIQPDPNRPHQKVGTKTVEGIVVGRDKRVVPPDEVSALAAMGCPDVEIADWFGITESTLRYNFSGSLTKGRCSLNQSLRKAQIRLALSGNATMLVWLGKNLLGQSDNGLASNADKILPWNDEDDIVKEAIEPTAEEELMAEAVKPEQNNQ